MKKITGLAFAAILLFSIILVGCAQSQTPSKVVKDFYNYIKTGNTAAAAKMFAEKDVKSLKDSGADMESVMKDLVSNFKNAGYEKFEVTSEKITGNNAVVEGKVYVKGFTQPVQLHLVKEKGSWKLTKD